jgi:hypothetical protein
VSRLSQEGAECAEVVSYCLAPCESPVTKMGLLGCRGQRALESVRREIMKLIDLLDFCLCRNFCCVMYCDECGDVIRNFGAN